MLRSLLVVLAWTAVARAQPGATPPSATPPSATPAPPPAASAPRVWTLSAHAGMHSTRWTVFSDDAPEGTGPSLALDAGVYVVPRVLLLVAVRTDHLRDSTRDPFEADVWYDHALWATHVGPRLLAEPFRWLRFGGGVGLVWIRSHVAGYAPDHDTSRYAHFDVSATLVRIGAFDLELAATFGRTRVLPDDIHVQTMQVGLGARWRSR